MKLFKLLSFLLLVVPLDAFAANPISSRHFQSVRASAILTTSYVGSTAVAMGYGNQLLCYVSVTRGSTTSIEAKVQYSQDNVTWYDDSILNTAGGTTSSDEYISPLRSNVQTLIDGSLTTAAKTIAAPNLGNYMRVAIKATGTLTSSLAAISCYDGAI